MANYEKKLIKKPNFDYRNIIIEPSVAFFVNFLAFQLTIQNDNIYPSSFKSPWSRISYYFNKIRGPTLEFQQFVQSVLTQWILGLTNLYMEFI